MSNALAILAQTGSSGSGAGTGGAILGGGMFIVFLLIGIVAFIVWIWMLIDLLSSNKPTNEKILWALVMVFLGILGSLIYMFVARGKPVTTA